MAASVPISGLLGALPYHFGTPYGRYGPVKSFCSLGWPETGVGAEGDVELFANVVPCVARGAKIARSANLAVSEGRGAERICHA
jgi:hypothetical protein